MAVFLVESFVKVYKTGFLDGNVDNIIFSKCPFKIINN